MAVFDDVVYWLAESLPQDRQQLIANYLNLNGGRAASAIESATHIITNTAQFEGWNRLGNGEEDAIDAVAVSVAWVDRSIILGKAQPPQFYSPDPAMIFSGITACATDMTAADLEVLSGGITALGGQWRTGLTRDVTHLFALGTSSNKYETALHYQRDTHMKVLLPHWFDDAVKLGVGGLDTAGYEWPEPRYLRSNIDGDGYGPREGRGQLSGEKKRLLQTAGLTDPPAPSSSAPRKDVWGGRRVLLSPSLELSGGRREAVETGIRRAGGVVVKLRHHRDGEDDEDEETEEEVAKVAGADVLVTRYRRGRAYLEALGAGKTVGTLAWVFHVEASGVLSAPTDQLLHYPVPSDGISDFGPHKITVTNYTGAAREYLKKLILAMGAEFTPNMSGANTIVVAAYISGLKTTKALNWSIPIVNHTWLEDCFVQWRALSVGSAGGKYIAFPKGVDFAAMVGERGVGRVDVGEEASLANLKPGEGKVGNGEGATEGKEKETQGTHVSVSPQKSQPGKGKKLEPVGTGTSAREVELAMGFGDRDAPMDQDHDQDKDGGDAMEVDEEPPPVKGKKYDRKRKEREEKNPEPERMYEEEESAPEPSPSPVKVKSAKKLVRRTSTRERVEEDPQPQPAPVDEEETVERPKSRLVRRASGRKELALQKAREEELELEREMEEAGPSSKSKSKSASKSKPTPVLAPKARVVPDEQEEDSDVAVVVISKGKSASKGKTKAPPPPASSDDEEEVVPKAKPVPKGKAKRHEPADSSDEDEKEVVPKTKTTSKAKPKPKATYTSTAKKRAKTSDDDSDVATFFVKPKSTAKATSKPPPLPDLNDTTTDEEDEPPPPKKPVASSSSKSKAKGKETNTTTPLRTPRRVVSVVLPASANSGKKSSAQIARTESLRAQAGEVAASTSSRPAKSTAAEPRSAGRQSVGSEGDISVSLRTPSKRSALIKATNHLHNIAVPDMNNFAQEKKRGFKPKMSERVEDEGSSAKGKRRGAEDADEEEGVSGKKKRRLSEGGSKKKVGRSASDDESEVENRPTNAKKARVAAEEDSEEEPVVKAKAFSSASKHAGASKTDPTTVKLMTTQVTLSEDVQKSLTKLGVRFTTKPADCTHLVVAQLVRTEKFLCAMAVAPFILKEAWALESAAAKYLLPEEKYMLQDIQNEKKFNFKLSDALRRAKAGRDGVFSKHVFYVTPKVPVDIKLLKAVVTAGGGQVSISTPTPRILKANPNRHAVSCPADVSLWRPLAQSGFTVYSPELLLTGALKQEIDWEDEANKVPDSA